MKLEDMSRDEVLIGLREAGVEQLGQVKRAYLEPSGSISITVPGKGGARGLPLYPPSEDGDYPVLSVGNYIVAEEDDYACFYCGHNVSAAVLRSLLRVGRQVAVPPQKV